jgi:hypothetical protein
MTDLELETRALALQSTLHNCHDSIQKALDEVEDCPLTERSVLYATSMISHADDFCHSALRQVNEIAAALVTAAIEKARAAIA